LPVLCLIASVGCSVFEDNRSPNPAQVSSEDLEAQPYPNLAQVPDKPPSVTPEQIRESTAAGLEADRANAQYTAPLTAAGTSVQSAAPPAPPPTAAQEVANAGQAAPTPAALSSVEQGITAVAAAGVPYRGARSSAQTSSVATQSVSSQAATTDVAPSATAATAAANRQATTQATPAVPTLDGTGVAALPPQTAQPAGTSSLPKVPAQGAVGSGTVQLVAVIYFANGSSALDRRDISVLREVAQIRNQYGGILRVIGHASSRTAVLPQERRQIVNLEVSFNRAEAVGQALQRAGVAADDLVLEGVSDRQPVYHEFMVTGEAGNRRAEIYLEY